jgi:hypothetical protein
MQKQHGVSLSLFGDLKLFRISDFGFVPFVRLASLTQERPHLAFQALGKLDCPVWHQMMRIGEILLWNPGAGIDHGD